ncbi:MAG: helix-turn-helix domain-containing protein [Pirellulaceae bacterium]|nr:helix-turn-helix domain-containing protein [Pirellulaceae bacterium]
MMTVKEAAAALNVSTRFVYRLCATGAIECYKMGSAIRISDDALKEYTEAQKRTHQQAADTPRTRQPSLQFLRLKRR